MCTLCVEGSLKPTRWLVAATTKWKQNQINVYCDNRGSEIQIYVQELYIYIHRRSGLCPLTIKLHEEKLKKQRNNTTLILQLQLLLVLTLELEV